MAQIPDDPSAHPDLLPTSISGNSARIGSGEQDFFVIQGRKAVSELTGGALRRRNYCRVRLRSMHSVSAKSFVTKALARLRKEPQAISLIDGSISEVGATSLLADHGKLEGCAVADQAPAFGAQSISRVALRSGCGRARLQPCRRAFNPLPHPSGRQPARTAFNLRMGFPPPHTITRNAQSCPVGNSAS